MSTFEIHPLADLIPEMTGEEYRTLRADIDANGLREPITLHEGKILDGRHRYRACTELGIDPETRDYDGTEPLVYVLSMNVHRRHLSTAQRAEVARVALPHFQEDARKRQAEGLRRGDEPAPGESRSGHRSRTGGEQRARDEAGKLVGVSGRTVSELDQVARNAPDLHAEVVNGDKKVRQAWQEMRDRERPEPEPEPKPKRSHAPAEQREADIRDLAGKGHRASQIAAKLGISVERVRELAREFDITLPDAAMGKTRALDPYRIVSETVTALEASAMSLDLVDLDAIDVDPEVAEQWATSLSNSLTPIKKLAKQLKEMARVTV